MSVEFPRQPAVSRPQNQDARDLLARLYREIGLAAVAAELRLPARETAPRSPAVRDIPAVLRGADRAA